MNQRNAPHLDQRRESDFRRLLLERAQQWLPDWSGSGDPSDFAHALLAVAARYQAEVAERLDRGGDKMALGFLDWLALRGQAAIPARMPVVFQLAPNAAAVTAPAPVQLMADAMGTPLMFETDTKVHLQPGQLQMVVAADSAADAYYLPPPGLSGPRVPAQWQLRSFAAAGARTLQLDPALGLEPDMVLDIAEQQFRIIAVNGDLITIDPPFPAGADFGVQGAVLRKVVAFDPFDQRSRSRQNHALYLGHGDLLNIESAATIAVSGLQQLGTSVSWHYWGLPATGAQVADWQSLRADASTQALHKLRGAIEEREIGGVTSRWLRATQVLAAPAGYPVTADEIRIGVNPGTLNQQEQPDALGVNGLVALSNTTPLELTDVIYPLGREPRQFDAFYLGSQEAFSKHGASVRVRVGMADASFTSLVSMRTGYFTNQFLAAVSNDGYLYEFWFDPATARLNKYLDRPPLRPPASGTAGQGAMLDAASRPALWSRPVIYTARDVFIAVSDGARVWLRTERATGAASWTDLQAVAENPGNDQIDGLVYLASGMTGMLFALFHGQLYARDPELGSAAWQAVTVTQGGADVVLAKIAPVVRQDGDMGAGAMDQGLLAVGDDGVLYAVSISAGAMSGHCTELLDHVLTSVAPAGLRLASNALLVVAVADRGGQQVLRAFRSTPDTLMQAETPAEQALDGPVSGDAVDVNLTAGQPGFGVSVQDSHSGRSMLAWWTPYNPGVSAQFSTTTIPNGMGTAAGTPILLTRHIAVPTPTGQVLVAELDLLRQRTFYTRLDCSVILPLSDTRWAPGDYLAITTSGNQRVARKISDNGVNNDRSTLYQMESGYGALQAGNTLLAYQASAAGLSTAISSGNRKKITLDAADIATGPGDTLLVKTTDFSDVYTVNAVTPVTRVATLDRELPDGEMTFTYWRPQPASGQVRPLLNLQPATNGNWDVTLLDRSGLTFPGATPARQHGTVFSMDSSRHPQRIALDREFSVAPPPTGAGNAFVVDGAIDQWSRQLGDVSANPQLSWEYWNGAAWWKLPNVSDNTLHLKRSGVIEFTIPDDLQPTEWAGKNNHWIRARLVGGDYGQARTEVRTRPGADDSTIQTIERFPNEINAPQVLTLRVFYAAGAAVLPAYVITEDNGALRDQSDANRTPNAVVTVFTPLSSAMPAATAADGSAAPAPPRALYLGFSKPLSGQPLNLFALVEREQPFDDFAPLRIEALCGEFFTPVTTEDATRALGEDGLLSLSLPLPTVRTALFGQPLYWLRLSPARQVADKPWAPALRGLYFNAVWARACETMTRERLGSSSGAPGQAFLLARPPLLHDTLTLRVREPLGEEERQALLADDDLSVVSDVASDLRGHWVRWRQVTDVADAAPLERVYSLDETTGEVRFGDGIHGMIPPTGRDALVAFTYQRTEPAQAADATPANSIAALAPLNLTSPVEGVESVFAADQSAGGAPPEDSDRVRRFAPARLRHRGRAVTLRDFEAHALHSSPDIAQARAFGDAGGVRVVVAMRGKDVRPGQAQRRELRRSLLAAAPPRLAHGRLLTIEPPALRRLRIHLVLRVDSLSGSGPLADQARRRLSEFFDTATGGLDRQGWPLGATPLEDDVGLALLDTPGIDSIDSILFEEIKDDGKGVRWTGQLRADQLAVLADDGVRLDFIPLETAQ